jgi:FkbM family methyltransferase
MQNKTRCLFRGLLPAIVVDYIRNKRIINRAGGSVGLADLLRVEAVRAAAEESSLALLPEGYGHRMKYLIDIGANEGQWSSAVLGVISPEKLIIVEPVPAAFALLQERLKGKANVTLNNIAVGDQDGTTRFFVTRDTKGASTLKPLGEWKEHVQDSWDIRKEITVQLSRIDTIAKELNEVSLLKIDVQGFEITVLRGAAETLKRTMFVLVELNFRQQYEGGSIFGEVYDLLTREYGFYLTNLSRPLMFDREAVMVDGLFANPQFVPRRVTR